MALFQLIMLLSQIRMLLLKSYKLRLVFDNPDFRIAVRVVFLGLFKFPDFLFQQFNHVPLFCNRLACLIRVSNRLCNRLSVKLEQSLGVVGLRYRGLKHMSQIKRSIVNLI